mgnify:CR=1 FL=1
MHAFTATATRRVRLDIVEQLGLAEPDVLIGSFDRPNLVYRVVRRHDLGRRLRAVVDRHRGEPLLDRTARKGGQIEAGRARFR